MRASQLPTSQRTILITGCSSGIGLHSAKVLAANGYRVFATARQAEDVAKLKEAGLSAYLLDLRDTATIHSALEQILAETNQQLFALFNNAGYGQPGAVEDITRELIREQFETNVFGTLELTNAVIPVMRKQGYGRIIQTSSVLGIINLPFRGAYNASKHALESLTDELVGSPIHISSIEPGAITSKFRANAYQQFMQRISIENSYYAPLYKKLMQRIGNPENEPPFAVSPQAVTKALLCALEAKNPKAHYYVTLPTHLLAFLIRCLPDFLLDKVLIRAAGEEGQELVNLGKK
jgi:NAD(P)-dependent dehydrogenase (short-subunit alcohol dehydrogenase family)